MPNKVLIESLSNEFEFLSCPLLEDITIQAQSSFTTMGELIPGMDFLNTMMGYYGAMAGGTQTVLVNTLKNMENAPRWDKTEPLKIPLKLLFYTQTSSETDVFEPVNYLLSLAIITMNGDGTFTVPGISIFDSLKDSAEQAAQKGKKSLQTSDKKDFDFEKSTVGGTTSKLVSIWIPGIVFCPVAYAETCNVTWSKHLTEMQYPLWATVDIQFSGIGAADTTLFNQQLIAKSASVLSYRREALGL